MGFKIFRKSVSVNKQLSGFKTDIHSHLIPGIDDGVKTIEESVLLIRGLSELGYTRIITTPHIRGEVYENTPEIIQNGLLEVQKAVANENIPVEIEAAAEYFVDDLFMKLVYDQFPLLTFGKNKHVLVEFSHFSVPYSFKTIIYDLQSMGYTVVLAHPERYYYFQNKFEEYKDLYYRGVQFQLNLVSLSMYYDRTSAKTAEKLIDLGLYTYVGSDIHNRHYLQSFTRALGQHSYQKLIEKCNIMNDHI